MNYLFPLKKTPASFETGVFNDDDNVRSWFHSVSRSRHFLGVSRSVLKVREDKLPESNAEIGTL